MDVCSSYAAIVAWFSVGGKYFRWCPRRNLDVYNLSLTIFRERSKGWPTPWTSTVRFKYNGLKYNSDVRQMIAKDTLVPTVDNLLEACSKWQGWYFRGIQWSYLNWKVTEERDQIHFSVHRHGDMDTASDDDGSNPDPLLSCSRDEDSRSDQHHHQRGRQDPQPAVRERDVLLLRLAPLVTEEIETLKEEEKESPFKLNCDITSEKVEAKSNSDMTSPQKADWADSL